MTTATCPPTRIALLNGPIRPLVCTKLPFGYWESEGQEPMHNTILYRSGGKCGEGGEGGEGRMEGDE